MIEVRLPIELWERGRVVGLARHKKSAERGGKPHFDYQRGEPQSPETHVYGARGEAAFAHALGLDWAGPVDTHREVPDVLPNWEVRTSASPHNFKVDPTDKPWLLVAFVLNERGSPVYQIVGYIIAGWCQKNLSLFDKPDKHGKPRGAPAYWPKEYDLCPINPGFHAVHGWMRDEEGRWVCAFCPEGRTA